MLGTLDEWERGASSWYKPGQMEEFCRMSRGPRDGYILLGPQLAVDSLDAGCAVSGIRAAREVNEAPN